MTLQSVENFNDNEIITADYWNSVLGQNGALAVVQKSVERRANCNVFSAKFNNVIEGNTRITYSRESSGRYFHPKSEPKYITFGIPGLSTPQVENNLFSNINTTNNQQIIQGIPFILIWDFSVITYYPFVLPNPNQPFPMNYFLRTTVERDYFKTGDSNEYSTETISSNFFNIKNNSVGTISFSTSSNIVTGVGTKFSDGDVGRVIFINVTVGGILSIVRIGIIASVTNATTVVLANNANKTLTGTSYICSGTGRSTMSSSICYASHSLTDRYYITIAHSFSQPIRVVGNVRLIINPGMV